MDRNTLEKLVRAFAYISATACIVVSGLFVVVSVVPWFYFNGYIRGYFSPLAYKLWYNMTGQPVDMPHTDYIRHHVVVVFFLLSIILSVASVVALAWIRRRIVTTVGVLYGISAGLVVLNGLFFGYIYRAVSYDIESLNPVTTSEVVLRTLAGTIKYPGVSLDYTLIHRAISANLLLLILILAVASSTILVGLVLYGEDILLPAGRASRRRLHKLTYSYSALLTSSLVLIASIFAYYPATITIVPQPPPATLEPPQGIVCVVSRTSRAALVYTDFETLPSEWSSDGGTWSTVRDISGATGNVLMGVDNDGGLGGESHYYYSTSLSAYSSLWVVAKTRWASGTGYYGIMLGRAPLNRMYAVEISTTGVLYILSYGIETRGWYTLASTTIPGYSTTNWYILVVDYVDTGARVDIRARVYDASGNLLTSTTASSTVPQRIRPSYIGVAVDGVSAYFDDFLISTTDPRNILFNVPEPGVVVEVVSNLGATVAWGVSMSTTLPLPVIHDVVVGTGIDGRISIGLPNGTTCINHQIPVTDALLGGDTYSVTYTVATSPSLSIELGVNKTSATVSVALGGSMTTQFLLVNSSQPLYARLILDNALAPPSLSVDVWLEGASTSTAIRITNGVPVETETSLVQMKLGLNNSMVLSGGFSASGQTAVLYLRLALCTSSEQNPVCVYYPITLSLSS